MKAAYDKLFNKSMYGLVGEVVVSALEDLEKMNEAIAEDFWSYI